MYAQLYGCFAADKRVSMDVYARTLQLALNSQGAHAELFFPQHPLERRSNSRLIMRYLRYRSYGQQLLQHKSAHGVQHVCDHGYAHLHKALVKNAPKAKSVLSVHDLIPYLTWKGVIPSAGRTRRPSLNLYSLQFAERYHHIVTISQNSKNDLAEFLRIAPDRIDVIPPIIADYFRPMSVAKKTRLRQRLGVGLETKLIMVSGSDHYKNSDASLAVMKRLIEDGQNVLMVKCGHASDSFLRSVQHFGVQDHVRSLYLHDHEELAELYAGADCLLFPSWYEGFGMPVAEALACGTPVVTSTRASLPEAGGELALYAEPDDIDGLCEQVLTCFTDLSHQQKVRQGGEAWVAPFRAPEVAKKMLELYRR